MAVSRREAFLRQARSDFALFNHLRDQDQATMPACHPLHYLQMAAEKLAKAIFDALGVSIDPWSHVAFSNLPYHLARADIARAIGFRDSRSFRTFLRRCAPIFRAIDELSPAVGASRTGGGPRQGPNVEYPWESRGSDSHPTWLVPAENEFKLQHRS